MRNHRPCGNADVFSSRYQCSRVRREFLRSQHLVQLCRSVANRSVRTVRRVISCLHYDVWHRKMKNKTQADRYMLKFQFTRLVSPTLQEIRLPELMASPEDETFLDMNPIWKANWGWISGIEVIKRKEKMQSCFPPALLDSRN